MTFSLRSLSARRYRIEGALPSVNDAAFAARLTDRRFQPLSPHEERTFGWVTADNCLDARFEAGSAARGPCAVFALRLDKRRVNGRLLRAMLDLEMRGRKKDAERAAEGAEGAPKRPGRVSREERAEVRRQITEELLRNTPPSMEVHPVLVYPRERMVLFGALSRPANEVFRALFSETFDVTLSALTPYHRALELLGERSGSESLAAIRRTDFGRSLLEAPATDVPAAVAARGAARPEVLR
ncbi:MAG: recombination-associated protein RdgC [Planctomycetes bacterium]|nr:recombination-associated protein RdgC [Planctomycetota bacterium]